MRNYQLLPEHMQDGMRRYLEDGVEPGSFLRLMLQHDIYEAAGYADTINLDALVVWIKFMYNEIPVTAHGSREAVDNWMASRRKKSNG